MSSPLDDQDPTPDGELLSQVIALPQHTNVNGDIDAGWLIGQMDTAGAFLAQKKARGRVTTVATSSMVFLSPVPVGCAISCYGSIKEVGRSSIRVAIEVWLIHTENSSLVKVTEGEFVFVAIDDQGKTRALSP